MPTTTLFGFYYPSNSSTSGFQAEMSTAASSEEVALVSATIPTFVDAAAANAAYVAASLTPQVGWKRRLTANQLIERYNGSTWRPWESDWLTWATAITNVTIGTGGSALLSQRYKYIGGRVLFQCRFVLGSSGASIAGQPTINLPMSLEQLVSRTAELVSAGTIHDVSAAATFQARARLNVLASNQVAVSSYTGTYAGITATAPMTWAGGDELAVEFWGDPV